MSMQDVSGWKHPKACTWASYMAGWETPYGVYLSPVEVGYLTAPEDSCLLLSDGRDTACIDLGDAYLGYAFEGITEDGIVDPIRILDASEVKWGNQRKVRLSNKVIEKVIKRVETQFNRSIR